MKTGSIYIIRNSINNKVYIGQTTIGVSERFKAHIKPSTIKKRGTYKIYNAIQKYGIDNFYVQTLESDIPIEELDNKEIAYISQYDSYRNGYNTTQGGDGRMIAKIEDEAKLLVLFNQGLTAEELANEFNCSKATILRTLHKKGLFYYKKLNKETLVALFNQGLAYKEIANQMDIPDWTVERYCKRWGLKRNKRIDEKLFDYEQLEEDYKNNISIQEICEKYNIGRTTFYRIKSKLGLETRPQVYKYKTRYK